MYTRRSPGRLLAIVVVFAAVGAALWNYDVLWRWSAVPRGAAIALDQTRLNLGNGKPNETRTGQITFRNTGTGVLTFQMHASCGCTDVRPLSGSVSAGGVQTVHVSLRLPDNFGSEKSASITIESNDVSHPSMTVVAFATCPAPLVIRPPFVDFGAVSSGELSTITPVVLVEAPAANNPLPCKEVDARLFSPKFAVETLRTSEGKCAIKMRHIMELPPGNHSWTMEVGLKGTTEWMHVPVRIKVEEKVLAVPSTLFVRWNPGMSCYEPVTLLLAERLSQGTSPLTNAQIRRGPPGVKLEELPAGNSRYCAYRVHCGGIPLKRNDELEIVGGQGTAYCKVSIIDVSRTAR